MSDFWIWALTGTLAYLTVIVAVLSVVRAGARADAWEDHYWEQQERWRAQRKRTP